MSLFFGRTNTSVAGKRREVIIKESLINNLSECVKAIQFDYQTEECYHQTIGSNDVSNSLCCALEAIFLHGVKDSFFKKAKNAFSTDVDQKPQPNFWSLILTLSHSNNIKHITSLQQITTEIGQCRSWLRMALNDCLLSSYLSTILKNMNLTKSFYSQYAFIRDVEMLDVAQRYLEGIESGTQFNLPVNSSLLNSWPEDVLVLTGIWIPPIRSCPIAAGVDIASTLKTEEVEIKKSVLNRESTVTGLGKILAIDQDEAFKYIIASTSDDIINEAQQNELNKILPVPSTSSEPIKETPVLEKPVVENEASSSGDSENINDECDPDFVDVETIIKSDVTNIGNSITGKPTWSTDSNDELLSIVDSDSLNADKNSDCKSDASLVDIDPSVSKTPYLREVMLGLQKELKLTDDSESEPQSPPVDTSSVDDLVLEGLGFEVISNLPSTEFDKAELKKMLTQIGKLSREYGLDSQDYQCKSCLDTLGTIISKAKVCAFSGEYFCTDCMDPNVFMIPARVIHNWDFKRYPVSKRAGLFLLEFQHQPLLNIKKINPLIYANVDDMTTLQLLRIQLNFLRAYLFTCREPVIEELQKRVWPREYLYEQIHLYSVSDLAQIPNGSLANQLQKVVSFARSHVHDCWLCSQKGFICEVCKNSKVLYPFDIQSTYRCEVCSSVYHSKCLNSTRPCPKCERRKKRHNISLVEAVHNNIE